MSFIIGLEEIVPREALDLFSEQEIGLQMAGVPTIDSILICYFKINFSWRFKKKHYLWRLSGK